jgi:trigger factor
MDIEIEEIDTCNRKIKFNIPNQDYKKKVQTAFQTLGRQVNIPGFRKGKVPVSLLEKQFGPQIKREALSELINDWVTQVIQDKKLRAVGPPSLLDVQAEEGTDIQVSATLEVLPEFELADYKDLEVDLKVTRVTDADVDRVIEAQREQAAKSVEVAGRPAQAKDFLKIDFTGTIEGEPFEGGEARDYVLQLGAGHLVEGLETALTGMSVGERKNAAVTFPEDFFNKKMAGRTVDFDITLKGLQEKVPPALDDAFAQSIDDGKKYESLADMKEKIRQEIEAYEQEQARKDAGKQLTDKLVDQNPVHIPEGLVKEQIRFMVNEAKKKEAAGAGAEHDHDHDHGGEIEISAADEEKHRPQAVRLLQQELVIDKLATELGVEITPADFDAEVSRIVQLLGGGDPAQLKAQWAKSGALDRLHQKMKREKTLEQVMGKVRTREEMVDRKENIADN